MEKEKNNPYKILKGAHYGVEENFSSYEERFNYLKNYAIDAERIYKKYKENPEKIKDEKELKKFEQFNLYQCYESDLILVEVFRDAVKKASRIAFLIKEAKEENVSSDEIKNLKVRFNAAKTEITKLINSLGPLLEFAHRRVLEKEKPYYEFTKLNKKKAELEALVELPLGESNIAQEIFKKKSRENKENLEEEKTKKELIRIAQARDYLREEIDLKKMLEDPVFLAGLKELSEEEGEDLIVFAENLLKKKEEEKIPSTKKEAKDELNQINSQLQVLWEESIVRYKTYQKYLEKLVKQDQFGDPVLEIPSVVKLMNKIAAWERRHTETPIGAVLIGQPGTGKSLGIEHYLATHPEHKKKGPPVIIDMSQETTEFILLGGESIEVTDRSETVKILKEIFNEEKSIDKRLENDDLLTKKERKSLISQKEILNKKIEDLIHAFQGQFVEAKKTIEKMKEENSDELAKKAGEEILNEAKKEKIPQETMDKIKKWIDGALVKWQAEELGKIMYGNGWRDGIILKALKEGRDIIINEYNNFRLPPDALRQLFQTAYGGEWFFAGTGKKYKIYSRIYLTANEGSSAEKFFYDTAQITAAFASRLPAPIEIELPPQEEELLILQVKLSDTNKKFLCNEELNARLYSTQALKNAEFILQYNEKELIVYLFKKVLPQLRALVLKEPKYVPSLDLRHIDRFCRDVVNRYSRERNNRISIEEAFIENFCKPFSNPNAWNVFCESGIVEEMYKFGILHQTTGKVHDFLMKVLAKKRGENLEYVSEEAKKNILTKLEDELQGYDKELIESLEKMEGKKWSEIVEKAKQEKKVLVLNPYLKEVLPISFSKYSPIPEEKMF